ncbi:hypothetical protein CB1_000576058 [Camelus ferus]|nr:hypothetical protein CB1_000576058 [Camelus ferus]
MDEDLLGFLRLRMAVSTDVFSAPSQALCWVLEEGSEVDRQAICHSPQQWACQTSKPSSPNHICLVLRGQASLLGELVPATLVHAELCRHHPPPGEKHQDTQSKRAAAAVDAGDLISQQQLLRSADFSRGHDAWSKRIWELLLLGL